MILLSESAKAFMVKESTSLAGTAGCIPGLVEFSRNPADISTYRFILVGWAPEDVGRMLKLKVGGCTFVISQELAELLRSTELLLDQEGQALLPQGSFDWQPIAKKFTARPKFPTQSPDNCC